MSIIHVGRVAIGGPIEIETSTTPTAVDGSGVLTVEVDLAGAIVVENGATVNGLHLLEDGDDWQPTDGIYISFIRAASTTCTVVRESSSANAADRFRSDSAVAGTVTVGPDWFLIWYDVGSSRWVVPDWLGFPNPIGKMELYGGATAPPGYLLCDGSAVLIADYPLLYAVIGTAYGGDGITDFEVPRLSDLPIAPSMTPYIIYAGQ